MMDVSTPVRPIQIRPARASDIPDIARILAEAFPTLYQATFGRLSDETLVRLLIALYQAETLSWRDTLLAEREGRTVGAAILNIGEPIGQGGLWAYGRVLLRQLPLPAAGRAFGGGIAAHLFLDRRIPHAPDLVYIEALAVQAQERGGGIGTALLLGAQGWTQARGRDRMALHVLHRNLGARRLYERFGFRPWQSAPESVAPRRPLLRLFQRLFRRPADSGWNALLMEYRLPDDRRNS